MEIMLSRGLVAVIDDEDFPLVSAHRWCASLCNKTSGGEYIYAATRINKKTMLLHRFLTGAIKGQVVDHINGNRLDNRRRNLRLCSHGENLQNRKMHYNNSSGLKGVYAKGKKWRAYIMANGKKEWLGLYATKEGAHEAYKAAALRLHGDFANSG